MSVDGEDLGRLAEYSWQVEESEAGSESVGVYAILPLTLNDRCFTICGGGDETLRVLAFQDETVQAIQSIQKHTDTITCLQLSADKTLLAAGAMDNTISIYKLCLTEQLQLQFLTILDGPSAEIEDLHWSPRGHVLVAASLDGSAWVWHAERGFVSVFSGHQMRLTHSLFVEYETDNKEVVCVCVTTGADGLLCIWDPQNGQAKHKLTLCPPPPDTPQEALCQKEEVFGIVSIDKHNELPLVVVGCADGSVHLVNVARGAIVAKANLFEGAVECLRFSPKECRDQLGDILIAGADSTGSISIWPVSTFEPRHRIRHSENDDMVTSLAWARVDSSVLLLSGGADGFIREWDPRDGSLRDQLFGMDDCVNVMEVFELDNALPCVVSGTEDGRINYWRVE